MKADKNNITIAYTGSAVDDGTMDVSILGPALMALGTLVNEANKTINNDNSQIAVKVNADFQKGSFEIQLDVIRTITEQLQSLFNNPTSVGDMLSILGLSGAIQSIVGIPSVIDFIKWVKKRKIDKITKHGNGMCSVSIGDETVNVNIIIINLYQSVIVRESLNDMISPVRREGINAFEVRNKQGNAIQSINKEESVGFEFSVADNTPEENISVQTYVQWVRILTVNFEDLKWRFQSGDNKYYAKIEDENFLKEIENGLSFTKGDTLQIELEQTQTVRPDSSIKNEYRVLKVLKVQKRAKQIELPFDEEV